MEAFLPLCLALGLAAPRPQDSEPSDAARVEAFAALPAEKQAAIVREVETAVRALETSLGAAVERILSRDDAPKPPFETWKGPVWFDPKVWAPGLPIPRSPLSEQDPKLASARAKFLQNHVRYEIEGRFRYFLGSNKILRLAAKDDPRLALAGFLAGYPPDADLAREIVLQILDHDAGMDALADYFDHAYTDREGGVYLGVTIYDVWNSGQEIEMPDVDAIPFARNILKDDSFKSPIPAGPRREGLYRKIGERFAPFRRYRVLREAVASCFFAADPPVSPLVAPLRDRIHFLILWNGGDPYLLGKFLKSHPERERFLEAADELMKELGQDAWKWLEARKKSLADDHRAMRETAIRVLEQRMRG